MNHELSHDIRPDTMAAGPVADGVDAAAGALHRAGGHAESMAHRGAQALLRGSAQLQAGAQQVSHQATAYIQREPVKAVLMAAAGGAVLMALMALVSRSRSPR
jgi:ElaB/YqjD/DUF883 family membrane-anchored ribosome-binding protein